MKTFFLLFFTVFFYCSSYSQEAPRWISYDQRIAMFPENQYMVGFKSDKCDRSEVAAASMENLLKIAKTQLIEQIRIEIKSASTIDIENKDTRSKEVFKQAGASTSEASLTGLKTDTYYDKKKKLIYAVAYVNKLELVKSCETNLADLQKRLGQKIAMAKQLATTGEVEQAMNSYYACYPMIHEMDNALALLVAIGKEPMDAQTSDLELQVTQGISGLRKGKQLDLDEACFFFASGLRQQIRNLMEQGLFDNDGFIVMGSFTFQDTRMGSELSSRLSAIMEQKLTNMKLTTYSTSEKKISDMSEAEAARMYILTGTYWQEGENLKIIANVKRNKDGRNLAGGQEFLSKSWVKTNNIPYLPANYELAMARQKELEKGTLPVTSLQVEVWTNKGNDNPLFARGDTMSIYMKANHPCFVRLIYYLADGQKTLLSDNYEVKADQVGKVFQYPDLFVCDSPFGAETIQVLSQTEPFKPLNTRMENGYKMILDDVKGIIANTRGMKSLNSQFQQAEKRLDLTTVEK